MKWRFLVLPVLAIAGASLAVYTVKKQARPAPVAPPSGEPTRSPFGNRVAGSGLVEPVTEIVNVGTPIGGVVEIHARPACRLRSCRGCGRRK